MLDSIRTGAQSWGVKIAFGVIILVFVFWGVGNFNDRDYSNVVAVVNGEPIVALEFEKAYHNAEEYLLRNNPGLTREQLIKDHLGRQVLNDLIRQTLLAQEAHRAGIVVSPQEMRLAVGQIKAFQDESGKFDPEAYKRILASQRITPAEYEKDLENQLLQDKIFALVTAPAWIDPSEALNRFNYLRERRIIDYHFTPASEFMGKITLSEAELKEWYENHKADFGIPPMVDAAYIKVDPADLVDSTSISSESLLAWYEANKSRYNRPERVHARHILVPLPENLDEASKKAAYDKIEKARAEIEKGKSFSQVADTVNEPGAADKGGDLGWIGHGQTVPEFEEAIFALPVGKVGGPIITPFGLHLIYVEEKQEAGPAPYESVAEEARKALAFEEGSEKLHEALDNLIEDNILQKPLEQAASRYNLKAEQTGLLDKKGLMEKLGIKAEAADALLGVPAGAPIDTALEAGDGYIVARIVKSEPASVKPFEQAKETIISRLKAERALEMALADAATLLAKIKNESPEQVRSQKITLEASQPLERGGNIPGFEPDEDLMREIFATKLHEWLPAPIAIKKGDASGAFIAYVDKLVPPGENEFEGIAEILTRAGKQERVEGIFGMFVQNLARKAKVDVTNPNLVDRVNM